MKLWISACAVSDVHAAPVRTTFHIENLFIYFPTEKKKQQKTHKGKSIRKEKHVYLTYVADASMPNYTGNPVSITYANIIIIGLLLLLCPGLRHPAICAE